MALMPVFAERFHMTPSDVWALTGEEMRAFRDRLEETG